MVNGDYENLQKLVRMLLSDLPSRRDWLDPVLELRLRDAVAYPQPVRNERETSPELDTL